jgi:tetratricopeptide (TPR) repeat protein
MGSSRVPREGREGRATLLSGIAIVAIAAGVLWATIGITLASGFAQTHPLLVLRFWQSSEANAQAASNALAAGAQAAQYSQARAYALRALDREPVNVSAVRTLASLPGDPARTARLFFYSEALSRRDLTTQLWLIEARVAADDIVGALRHYDRALRVTPQAGNLLYPILVAAAADPQIATSLVDLLRKRPDWRFDFLANLVADSKAPEALPLILSPLKLDYQQDHDRSVLDAAASRLVAARQYGAAFKLYGEAVRHAGAPFDAVLRNGTFDQTGEKTPFDWWLSDQEDLAAAVDLPGASASGPALFLMAEDGRGGEVARQLLLLRPGAYRLAFRAGDVRGNISQHPRLAIVCENGAEGAVLADMRMPDAPVEGRDLALDLTIPATDCPAQWLRISAYAGSEIEPVRPWLDTFRLAPRE